MISGQVKFKQQTSYQKKKTKTFWFSKLSKSKIEDKDCRPDSGAAAWISRHLR
jgi:hypothetical protein